MPTTLTIIPVVTCNHYNYVLLKTTPNNHVSLMTTPIEGNQDPIETAIAHFIKETSITDIEGYSELNPVVSEDNTNKIIVLYVADTNDADGYTWFNEDRDSDAIFSVDGDYTILDPLVYTAGLLIKEYNTLDDNKESIIVIAHKDHQYTAVKHHVDQYDRTYYITAPSKRELNSFVKLIEKWELEIDVDTDGSLVVSTDKVPDYAITITLGNNEHELATFDVWDEKTKTFNTYQKLINYADRWFTKHAEKD